MTKLYTSYDRQKARYHEMLANEKWKLSRDRKILIALSLWIIGGVVLIKLLGLTNVMM